MKIKAITTVLLLTLYAIFLTGCTNKQAPNTKVIAEVNGEKVTQTQWDDRINLIKGSVEKQNNITLDPEQDKDTWDKITESAYQNLISIALVEQDAQKLGVKVEDKTVNAKLENIKQQLNQSEQDGFSHYLQQLNITEQQLWNQLKIEELFASMQKRVAGTVTVSDAEIEKYYQDNISQFTNPGGIQIYHIIVETEATAREVLAKLKQGEDFAALAKEYSTDGTRSKGGDLGLVNEQTNFVPEFKQAALALKPGEMTTEPVKTEFGYHIIKAGERIEPTVTPLDTVKNSIKSQLTNNKQEEIFNQYIDSLKGNADIKDYRNS